MLTKILLVEDDCDSARLIHFQLEQAGYDVRVAPTGAEGLQTAYSWQPDLILLDVMLPGMNGWIVCERLRKVTSVPIMFVTVLDQEKQIVHGLRLGADDYVTKPFSHRELLARIEALLRRQAMESSSVENLFVYDDLTIDLRQRRVKRDDQLVLLTRTEYKLLCCLAETPGKCCPHSYLIRRVWGTDDQSRNRLKLCIWYLRKKIEPDPSDPKIILTDYGIGYRLRHPGR
jgi:two-component system KDP operon response regulator KdpE